MREKFGQDYIQEELKRIGKELEEPLQVYLIGGGAMAFQRMKEATKDIDVVVTAGKDLKLLQKVLKRNGYSEVKETEEEYRELGTQVVLENEAGCRFDIFNQQVTDDLIFSEPMQERSEGLDLECDLQLMLTAAEDIFLFKCVAGRTTDIGDMDTLVQSGLNFETIQKEVEVQIDLLGEELFITHVVGSLNKFEEEYGTTTPLPELLEEMVTEVYDQLEVLSKISGKTGIKELRESTEVPEERLETALKKLEEKGGVEIENNKIEKTENPNV